MLREVQQAPEIIVLAGMSTTAMAPTVKMTPRLVTAARPLNMTTSASTLLFFQRKTQAVIMPSWLCYSNVT